MDPLVTCRTPAPGNPSTTRMGVMVKVEEKFLATVPVSASEDTMTMEKAEGGPTVDSVGWVTL